MVDKMTSSNSTHTATIPRGTAPRGIGVSRVMASRATEASPSSRLTAQLDHAMRVGESPREILECDLSLELDGLPVLREAIAYCDSIKDYTSGRLFKDILDSEEEHVDWIETQLDLIDRVGEQNYLQSKMGGTGS